MDDSTTTPEPACERELTLLDTTAIIVGIIIGAVVFQSATTIAAALPNVGWLLAAWLAGGFIAWLGALCYAEWGTRYPHGGGDYHYLAVAFGPRIAWVFGWMQLLVIRPGSVGFFALAFGKYAEELAPLGLPYPLLWYGVAALTLSTLVNLCGLREGLLTQRILTTAKLLGLLLVIVVGCLVAVLGKVRPLAEELPVERTFDPALAMIFILYAYGGWNEVGYLGGEVRSARRTIPRTLGWGLAVVAVLYALLNLSYAEGLGWERFVASPSPAAEILAIPFGAAGETVIHLLLCVTLFGALHGSLLTGARLTRAFVSDTQRRCQTSSGMCDSGASLRPSLATPEFGLIRAYLIEYVISLAALLLIGRTGDPNALIIFASPPFWLGLFLVGLGLLRVRQRESGGPSDASIYRVPWYPGTVLVFLATCLWLAWASTLYARDHMHNEAWGVMGILAVGIALSFGIASRADEA